MRTDRFNSEIITIGYNVNI